jgi:hypothetical protein
VNPPQPPFPRFSASDITSAERNGEVFFRGARATSAVSQAEADELAAKLARERADAAARGEPTVGSDGGYPYPSQGLVEPVLEQVFLPASSPAVEIGRITRNNYEAAVLNTYGVMFVDVDTMAAPDTSPDRIVDQDIALSALVAACEERKDLGFRVYATRAGLRYLCTSRTFDPVSTESHELLHSLKSDPRYATLCRVQKCYRARITPKPWRCVEPAKPKGFFAKIFQSGPVPSDPANFATCHFLQAVGSAVADPAAAKIQQLHDDACGAQSSRPLA